MNYKKKRKLILVIALMMVIQPLKPTIIDAAVRNQSSTVNVSSDDLITPTNTSLSKLLKGLNVSVKLDNDNEMVEQDHPAVEELYEQLEYHDRIYDEDGGFYELVPIEDIIPIEDLERVLDELNDDEYSIVTDLALFNVNGEELSTARMYRMYIVRHQRFLGTPANSRYFFRHIPGFHQGGYLPPTNEGTGWRTQTWEINIGGSWIRAFCTQPGIVSAHPGHDDLPGWNPSDSGGLTQIQRDTIGRILQHGYRNIHRPPTSNSENWVFPSSSGADDLLDDAILVTQMLIQEVAADHWNMNNITLGTRSPINGSGVHGDQWRRLIANSETSNGMVGGPTGNVTEGIGGESFNPRPAVGSTRRMDMYDAIRHDVYFFGRRNGRPSGTSASSTTSNRPVHTLTWSNSHQMYRVEIDDRISSGGTGTLRRFFGTRTSGSLGIGGGYRFCRGTQTNGVCNPSETSNRLIIYTTNSNAQLTNTSDTFMRWNPTGSRDQAVGFFVNPTYQNKVIGARQGVYDAYFRVEITPRDRQPVRAYKYSTSTNERLAGTEFELCRGTADSTTTNFAAAGAQAWCWRVTSNDNGIADFPIDETVPSRNNANMFEGMLPGRVYRLRETSAPTGYLLNSTPQFISASNNGGTALVSRTFRNDLVYGRLRIDRKFGNHIVGFEPYEAPEEDAGTDEEITEEGVTVNRLRNIRDFFNGEELQNPNPPHLYGGLEPTPRQGIRWIFEDQPIEGVRINIYAREDVVLKNGSVVHEAGDFVAYYYTNEGGFIETNSLHLGSYFARETSAPNGWYIHDIEIDFELTYEDQYTAIVFDEVEIENQWQQVEINLIKTGETFDEALGFTEVFVPLEGVQFGLLAGEDFEMPNGQTMPEGALIKDGFTNAYGELKFLKELPLGRFCIQELAVADFYVVDDTLYCFEHNGEYQKSPVVEIIVTELEGLINYFVRGSFEIIKISAQEPEDVDVIKPDEESYEEDENNSESDDSEQFEEQTSEEDETPDGEETNDGADIDDTDDTDDIDYERWLLPDVEFRLYLLNPLTRETDPDNETDEASEIDENGEYEEIEPSVDINNDANNNEKEKENDTNVEEDDLPDLDLDDDTSETHATYVGTFVTDEDGRIFVDGLIFGDYMLVESVAHYRHQLLLEPIFLSVSYNHEHHKFEVVNYQTRTEIIKLDDLLEPLAGAKFHILDYETEELVMEFTSTLESEVIFALAHQTYILREIEAPYGYMPSEDIIFTVTDGQDSVYITVINDLDSSVEISTQAHTGDETTQYFTHGDIIEMLDNIKITHTHIRVGTPRAFKVYLFAVNPGGNPASEQDRTLVWESDYREYTVDNINMTFTEGTRVDTSEFSLGTTFFFAETAYREVLDEDDNRIGWEEDYRHNFDGSDGRQTLFPRDTYSTQQPEQPKQPEQPQQPQRPQQPQQPRVPQLRLPQTGSTNRAILFVTLISMVAATTVVVVKARKPKVNRISMSNKDK